MVKVEIVILFLYIHSSYLNILEKSIEPNKRKSKYLFSKTLSEWIRLTAAK